MKLVQAIRNILPTRIKTPEQCKEILSSKHEAVQIFGLRFSPRYTVKQDIFDSATKGKPCVTLPENLHLTLRGEIRKHFKIKEATNAHLDIEKPELGSSSGAFSRPIEDESLDD